MAKRGARERWDCPARDCADGGHDRQRSPSPAQSGRIPPRDRRAIEDGPAGAFRCRACGCVYLHDSHLDTVVGFLDGPVPGTGWHPVGRR